MRTSSWLGLSGILLVGVMAACSAPGEDESGSGTSGVTERTFQKDDLVEDAALRDVDAMSVAKVQAFLEKTPWSTKSVLADYSEDGKSAAEILVGAAQRHRINPLALLVRAQMEQGLIAKKTATDATIAIAMGCACPESSICSDKFKGFSAQAECAAGTLSRSMDRAMTSKGTVSGWARYRTKATEDGIKITPKNAATAALYTYTPWVGQAGGGKKGVGGASLHYQVWTRFAEALSYKPAGGNEDDDTTDPLKTADSGADAKPPTTIDAGSAPDASEPMDPPETEPATDAGSPTTADAGPKPSGSEGEGEGAGGPEGAEDDAILTGNAPPASNAPPPRPASSRGGSASSSAEEEEEEASEEDLDTTKKGESSGCSSTGRTGGGDAVLIAGAALACAIGGRRRRR